CVVIPAPPQILGKLTQALMGRGDELAEPAGLADNWSQLSSGSRQHAHIILAKAARFDSLNDQHALEQSPVNQGDAQKRMIRILARLGEVLESSVRGCVLNDQRHHAFSYESDQALVKPHSYFADAFLAEPDSCRQHQIGTVSFEQVDRADVGLEPLV